MTATALMPQRIQRRRVKGWRMPAGAIYVGRGSRYGNSFDWRLHMQAYGSTEIEAKQWARDAFEACWREHADGAYRTFLQLIRGSDLACWCKTGEPCHADVLLELANPPSAEGSR